MLATRYSSDKDKGLVKDREMRTWNSRTEMKPGKSRTSEGNQARLVLLTLVLLLSIVWALYGNFLGSPFAFDDSIHILRNQAVTSFKGLFDVASLSRFFETFSGFGLSSRPLLMLTYALNFQESGASPAAYRTTNVVVHTINSFLVFFIVFELAGPAQLDQKRRYWLSCLAAALFAAHPLATESVTYIAGRSASLCATFYFAGLYAVLRAGRAGLRARWLLLASVIASTAIGWLVKQDAVTLPAAAVALVWLAWPHDVPSGKRCAATAVMAGTVALLLIAQVAPLMRVSATTQGNSALVTAGYEKTLPFSTYVLTSLKVYSSYYLWRLWVPIWLSVDPEVSATTSPFSVGLVISLILLMGMAGAVFWLRSRKPLIAIGFALILISPLSAYCVFPLADVVAEHRAYIAIVGSTLILADVLMRSQRALWLALGVLVTYGWLTIDRNKVWADDIRLWQDAIQKAPNKIRPHVNLGAVYQAHGKSDQAIGEYEFVLRQEPSQSTALANLAALYTDKNDLGRAEKLLNSAIAGGSQFPPIYIGMAVVRLRQSRLDEAKTLLDHASELDPLQVMIRHNLGDILFERGQPAGAVEQYLKELQINPDSVITHLHLANAYEVLGVRDRSLEQYRIVATVDPYNPQVQSALQRLR
jgi:Tfp pilus assembly protein PilF